MVNLFTEPKYRAGDIVMIQDPQWWRNGHEVLVERVEYDHKVNVWMCFISDPFDGSRFIQREDEFVPLPMHETW